MPSRHLRYDLPPADESEDHPSRMDFPETQFQPESGDSELLWDVIGILDEYVPEERTSAIYTSAHKRIKRSHRGEGSSGSGGKGWYLVDWEGTDPITRKRYAPTWEPKTGCTDLLIQEWKAQKEVDEGLVGRYRRHHPQVGLPPGVKPRQIKPVRNSTGGGRPSSEGAKDKDKRRNSPTSAANTSSTGKGKGREMDQHGGSNSRLPPTTNPSKKRKRHSSTPLSERESLNIRGRRTGVERALSGSSKATLFESEYAKDLGERERISDDEDEGDDDHEEADRAHRWSRSARLPSRTEPSQTRSAAGSRLSARSRLRGETSINDDDDDSEKEPQDSSDERDDPNVASGGMGVVPSSQTDEEEPAFQPVRKTRNSRRLDRTVEQRDRAGSRAGELHLEPIYTPSTPPDSSRPSTRSIPARRIAHAEGSGSGLGLRSAERAEQPKRTPGSKTSNRGERGTRRELQSDVETVSNAERESQDAAVAARPKKGLRTARRIRSPESTAEHRDVQSSGGARVPVRLVKKDIKIVAGEAKEAERSDNGSRGSQAQGTADSDLHEQIEHDKEALREEIGRKGLPTSELEAEQDEDMSEREDQHADSAEVPIQTPDRSARRARVVDSEDENPPVPADLPTGNDDGVIESPGGGDVFAQERGDDDVHDEVEGDVGSDGEAGSIRSMQVDTVGDETQQAAAVDGKSAMGVPPLADSSAAGAHIASPGRAISPLDGEDRQLLDAIMGIESGSDESAIRDATVPPEESARLSATAESRDEVMAESEESRTSQSESMLALRERAVALLMEKWTGDMSELDNFDGSNESLSQRIERTHREVTLEAIASGEPTAQPNASSSPAPVRSSGPENQNETDNHDPPVAPSNVLPQEMRALSRAVGPLEAIKAPSTNGKEAKAVYPVPNISPSIFRQLRPPPAADLSLGPMSSIDASQPESISQFDSPDRTRIAGTSVIGKVAPQPRVTGSQNGIAALSNAARIGSAPARVATLSVLVASTSSGDSHDEAVPSPGESIYVDLSPNVTISAESPWDDTGEIIPPSGRNAGIAPASRAALCPSITSVLPEGLNPGSAQPGTILEPSMAAQQTVIDGLGARIRDLELNLATMAKELADSVANTVQQAVVEQLKSRNFELERNLSAVAEELAVTTKRAASRIDFEEHQSAVMSAKTRNEELARQLDAANTAVADAKDKAASLIEQETHDRALEQLRNQQKEHAQRLQSTMADLEVAHTQLAEMIDPLVHQRAADAHDRQIREMEANLRTMEEALDVATSREDFSADLEQQLKVTFDLQQRLEESDRKLQTAEGALAAAVTREVAVPDPAVQAAIVQALEIRLVEAERKVEIADADRAAVVAKAEGSISQADHQLLIAGMELRLTDADEKLQAAKEQSVFCQDLYANASNQALLHAQKARDLTDEVAKLKGQLSLGLQQQRLVYAGGAKAKSDEITKLRGQLHLLVEQNRLVNDDLRDKALKYPGVLSELEALERELEIEKDAREVAEEALRKLRARAKQKVPYEPRYNRSHASASREASREVAGVPTQSARARSTTRTSLRPASTPAIPSASTATSGTSNSDSVGTSSDSDNGVHRPAGTLPPGYLPLQVYASESQLSSADMAVKVEPEEIATDRTDPQIFVCKWVISGGCCGRVALSTREMVDHMEVHAERELESLVGS